MLTYDHATELVTMLSPLVQKHLELIQVANPTVATKLQIKLARVYAMEEKGLSADQMMLMWEAYEMTTH